MKNKQSQLCNWKIIAFFSHKYNFRRVYLQFPLSLIGVSSSWAPLKSEFKSFLIASIFQARECWEPEKLERAACAGCQHAKTFSPAYNRHKSRRGGNIPTDSAVLLFVLVLIYVCSFVSFQPLHHYGLSFLMALTVPIIVAADQMYIRFFNSNLSFQMHLSTCLLVLLLLFPKTSQAPRQLLPTVLPSSSAVTGLTLSPDLGDSWLFATQN